MLNRSLKKSALEKYEQAVQQYDARAVTVQQQSAELHELRQGSAKSTIAACQAYVSALANSPREFEQSIREFRVEYGKFAQLLVDLRRENSKHEVVSGSVVGAGAAVGVGVAAFAPTAAMAVATTFGVASTGTAISALTGVAATNAALAWLGGGALVAGGSGMVGGTALLALAGPIGWTIGGLGLVAGGIKMSQANAKIAEKATRVAIEVETGIAALRSAETEIQRLIVLTTEHATGVSQQLEHLYSVAPSDYREFSEEDKHALAALINNVRSLSELLNFKVA